MHILHLPFYASSGRYGAVNLPLMLFYHIPHIAEIAPGRRSLYPLIQL